MRPCRHFLLALFSILSLFMLKARSQTPPQQNTSNHSSVSAIFIFGDSTVDPGNNNHLGTFFRSNFLPYGRDFPGQIPTGRFSNGRLVTDYIASYVGVKEYVPPYLESTLSTEELLTGVSFASAGSGFDPMTPQITGVISIPQQLEYFKEYRAKIELAIGKKRTQSLIKKAAFLVSAGTNDFVLNYFSLPVRRQSYTVSSYQQFLIQQLQQFIQDLEDQGAELIGIVGLPPMGCLPAVITLNSDDIFHQRGCIESLSSVARDYNRMLQNKLKSLNNGERMVIYADIYTPLIDIIQGHKSGFDVVNKGCCGTGLYEASVLCNPESPVCPDASKYVFWDAIHPTEKAYSIIFESFRSTIDVFLNLNSTT